jgi:predicted alpha/beta superfamily hydrolase
MQKLIIFEFLLFTVSIFGQTELDPNKYYAETNTVFIKSKVFEKERELQIFIPDEYFKNPDKKFKVLYLFDAQNQRIFNYISGNIQFLSMTDIEPMIIVGVVTEDRWSEFLTPNNHEETLERYKPPMGNADLLIKHIQEEIEPYLKQNYRTEDYRLAIGQSLGATFLTYAAMSTENLFDYNIVISPNYDYDQKQFVERFKKFVKTDLSKTKRFYFANSYGDDYEQKFSESLNEVIEILKYSNNPQIKWNYKKLDIDKHGLTWLGVYNGLLNWKEKSATTTYISHI